MTTFKRNELYNLLQAGRLAGQMSDGSLLTEDEEDDFVADALGAEDLKRVTMLLEHTPVIYAELLERRERVRAASQTRFGAADVEAGAGRISAIDSELVDRRHAARENSLALCALTDDERVLDFPEQVGAFLACRDRIAGQRFLARFIHPVTGIWLRFCRALIAGVFVKPSRGEVVAFVEDIAARHTDLGCGGGWREAAVVMYDCAVQMAPLRSEGRAPQMSRLPTFKSQPMMTQDVMAWLGESPSARILSYQVNLPVMLCEPDGRSAHKAMLHLELLDRGAGALLSAPCMAMMPLDEKFTASLVLACEGAHAIGAWNGGHDVRWSLMPPSGMDASIFRGGSLGTAMLFGIAYLSVMAKVGHVAAPLAALIRQVSNTENLCFACALGDETAGGILAKIKAALDDGEITTVVCRSSAREIITAKYGSALPHAANTWLITRPHLKEAGKLSVVVADTLDEAVEAAVVEQMIQPVFEGWKKNIQAVKVERAWITQEIEKIVNRPDGRIALIIGQMGSGKSSYVASRFEELRLANDPPAAHFIDLDDQGSDDPTAFMRSLCSQLCRKYRLPWPTPPRKIRAWADDNARLKAAQELVACLLNVHDKTHKPEVIYIDALDEAFDERARFYCDGAGSIPDLLRVIEDLDSEWSSVRIVATSRDAVIEGTTHLANLSIDPASMLNLCAEQHLQCVKSDLADFFVAHLKCDRERAEKAADAAEGSFLFARLYLKQPDDIGGIKKLLDRSIDSGCLRLAARKRTSQSEADAALINALGLLAAVRTPLRPKALADLLGEKRREQMLDAIKALPEFFDDATHRNADRKLRWLHGYIPEFILSGARDGTKSPRLHKALSCADATVAGSAFRAWHAEIAMACLGWRALSGEAATYAVKNLLAHLRHARMWDQFAKTVTDVEFLRERLRQPNGCRDLVKSLQRALKKERMDTQSLPQRPLMKMIFDVLVGLSEADSGDWQHVFQELFNHLPEMVPLDFLGAIEAALTEEGATRVWLRITDGAERKKITHVPLEHPCGVLSVGFSRTPHSGGQWLVVTAGVDRKVRIWKSFPPRLVKEPIDLAPVRPEKKPADAALVADADVKVTTSRMGLPPTGVAFVDSRHHNLVTLCNGVRYIQADLNSKGADPVITASTDTIHAPHSLAVPTSCHLPLLAVGYPDGSVHVYDADFPKDVVAKLMSPNPLGMEHGSARPQANSYGCIAISPDGSRIAVALPDQYVRIWSLDLDAYRAVRGDNMWKACVYPTESMPEASRGPLKGRICMELPPAVDRRIDSMAWCLDGTVLAIGGGWDRGVVELWDVEKRSCTLFDAHKNSVWALAWLLAPAQNTGNAPRDTAPQHAASQKDAWILVSGSYDRTFALWSYDSILRANERHGERWKRPGYVENQKVEFEFINHSTPAPLAVRAHSDVVLSIAVSPDHTLIATAGGDHEANVWEVEDLLSLAYDANSPAGIAHGNVIHGASISPDGEALVTASEDGILRFWDMRSRPVASPISFDADAKAAQTVKFAPAGFQRAVLVGTKNSGAFLCELGDDFSKRHTRRFDGGCVTSVAFNPRPGAAFRLAIGHESGEVTIHSAAENDTALTCPLNHSAPVRSVAFSPIAPVLASAGNDKIVIIWNYETGACFKLPECHKGRIKSAAFSPDGKWLASGGRETIRIYDTESWSLVETILAHNNEIWTLEWSPCGNILASGAKDKTVRLWNMRREHQGSRKLASLPCTNSVVAIWFNPASTTLHVADPGAERRKPSCTSVDIRHHTCAPDE